MVKGDCLARLRAHEAAALSAAYLVVLLRGGIKDAGCRKPNLSEVALDAVAVLDGQLRALGAMSEVLQAIADEPKWVPHNERANKPINPQTTRGRLK
jgi:hypothetical protein